MSRVDLGKDGRDRKSTASLFPPGYEASMASGHSRTHSVSSHRSSMTSIVSGLEVTHLSPSTASRHGSASMASGHSLKAPSTVSPVSIVSGHSKTPSAVRHLGSPGHSHRAPSMLSPVSMVSGHSSTSRASSSARPHESSSMASGHSRHSKAPSSLFPDSASTASRQSHTSAHSRRNPTGAPLSPGFAESMASGHSRGAPSTVSPKSTYGGSRAPSGLGTVYEGSPASLAPSYYGELVKYKGGDGRSKVASSIGGGTMVPSSKSHQSSGAIRPGITVTATTPTAREVTVTENDVPGGRQVVVKIGAAK